MATAHYNYAKQIPDAIKQFIPIGVRDRLEDSMLSSPVGETAIMHTHNTFPSMAQRYHLPMWKVPSCDHLDSADVSTIKGNRSTYEDTKNKYTEFATALLTRLKTLE